VKALCDRASVMKNGKLVGTVEVDDVTEDDILGMIIARQETRDCRGLMRRDVSRGSIILSRGGTSSCIWPQGLLIDADQAVWPRPRRR
jgi:ABC-type sugar transport system ATPase subunit